MRYAPIMSARAWLAFVLLLVGCGHTTLIVFEEPDGGADVTTPPHKDGGKDAEEDANEGGVTTLAAAQLRPLGIALSASEVYWSNVGAVTDAGSVPETGSIMEAERKGGGVGSVVSNLTEPQVLAYATSGSPSGALAWSELTGSTGTVRTLLLATGEPVQFTGLDLPVGVAIDGDRVYWVSSNGFGISVESAPLAGGATTTLGSTADENGPGYIAVTPADTTGKRDIYVTGDTPAGGGTVYALPLEGGTMRVIWSTPIGEPYDIVADKTNVYWAVPNLSDGTLYQMTNLPPFDAGTSIEDGGDGAVVENDAGPGFTSPVVLASSLTNSFFLAVDSTHVYFTTNVAKTGGVFSVPIGGGTVTTLADNLSFPGGIAADDSDDFVYFTTISTIARVHK
jgi:hypothetical protein